MRRAAFLLVAGILLFHSLATAAAATAAPRRRGRRPAAPPQLVWHVETMDGQVVSSNHADGPINPASVVKVATSMWALERLGPDYRFETRVFGRGAVDEKLGVLRGDLVVAGSGDPDFHAENAFLVAQALNRLGVREVRGRLIVNTRFWMGWENGSEGTIADPFQRGLAMATRLRQALDPRRWSGRLRRTWREFATDHGLAAGQPFRVAVTGAVAVTAEAPDGELLLVHRSEPLATALRRFNCFSANDIERIGTSIGSPEELAGVVAARCGAPGGTVQLATTSGLGVNRVSPATIVRMMREFRESCERAGLGVEALLPVGGCDPGTVTGAFPLLANGDNAGSVVGKTGTLTTTDGGVAVLAGFASTARGELAFCVAAPNARGRLAAARAAEQRWLLDLIAANGGPRPRTCAGPLPGPDAEASVILLQ